MRSSSRARCAALKAQAHGVIGNVVRICWKNSDEVRAMLQPTSPSDEPLRFCLGGVVLIGRRVQDPLWRDVLTFREKVKQQQSIELQKRLDRLRAEGKGVGFGDVAKVARGQEQVKRAQTTNLLKAATGANKGKARESKETMVQGGPRLDKSRA